MNFSKILEKWYENNKRDLPWRESKDPYRIWVSEIILQQTRIDQGWHYYLQFLEKFPDLKALAEAEEFEVLKIWQGLGYYSRARNMHATARTIIEKHNGIFPETFEEIRKLKGIGDYTAAAISSISFGIASPVVDGNVLRLFSRFYGIFEPIDTKQGKTIILEKAKELINHEHPGNFNQAIMEFGALQCKPIPDCSICPMKSGCIAFRQKRVDGLPVKSKTIRQRTRYFHYLVIMTKKGKSYSIFLKKRTENDIWKNLFDFPLIETVNPKSPGKIMLTEEWTSVFSGIKVTRLKVSQIYRHILTHQVILAKFYQVEIPESTIFPFIKVNINDLSIYPVPKLVEKYLRNFSL